MELHSVNNKVCLPGIRLLNNELSSISSILEKEVHTIINKLVILILVPNKLEII